MTIVDRLKNCVKLHHGEFIALEQLELVFRTSRLVSQICVYGDSSRTHTVAIVVPVMEQLLELAAGQL